MLPDGLTLERREVRGEISDGMILAEDEVGLGADHSGIMLLPDTAEPGTYLADVLPIVDDVLIVESTGNRPDLQSIYGIAREIAAIYDLPLSDMAGAWHQTRPKGTVEVQIDDFAGCPRYIGRLFENVAIGPSPVWLRARLNAAGMRPISNVVDVTNYVMLALGNPLHAFDFAKLEGGRIVVRRAAKGEKMRTLDGSLERELTTDDLMIADAGPRDRARRDHGRRGDRDRRDHDRAARGGELRAVRHLPLRAAAAAHRRLEPLGEGRRPAPRGAGRRPRDEAHSRIDRRDLGRRRGRPRRSARAAPSSAFGHERADEVIGVETPAADQDALLERLGFERRRTRFVVPTWRARDVTREIDVVEEIARFRLDDVPFTLPARREMFGTLTREQQLRRRLEDALVGLGFAETYTPSLVPDDDTTWKLPEPISVELTALRTTLLPSLVEAARRNVDAGARSIALFEIARVYLPDGDLPAERVRVAGIAAGGFLHVKGVVEALYAALKAEPSFERTQHPLLHPGKAARTQAGVVGELHPRLLEGEWGAFELDLAALRGVARAGHLRGRDHLSGRPAGHRRLGAGGGRGRRSRRRRARRRARAARDPRLRRLPRRAGRRGRKSVAFSVAFQSPERTLSEEDATRPLRAALRRAPRRGTRG